MRQIKKFRLAPLVIAASMVFSSVAQAATVIGSKAVNGVTYSDYHSCVSGRNTAGGQVNDECFLAFDKFITVANPVTSNNDVYIDETHRNFHKISEGTPQRYLPFAKLLEKGGYKVSSLALKEGEVAESVFVAWLKNAENKTKTLVIANPLHPSNDPEVNWLGTIESAFTDTEITALVDWVNEGGNLMLVADHFPFPGSMTKLGAQFGFFMDNGYSFDPQYNDDFLFSLLLRSANFRAGHSYDPVADIMTLKKKITDLSPDGGTKYDVILQKERQRLVKDDLVDIVRLIMVKLGADVNSMNFWADISSDPKVWDANSWFAKGDGRLSDHPVIRGRQGMSESIPWLTSFTGQSFTYVKPDLRDSKGASIALGDLVRLMELGKDTYTLITTNQDAYFGPSQSVSEDNLVTYALGTQKIAPYSVAKKDTGPRLKSAADPSQGYVNNDSSTASLQGAALTVGKGKLVMFGEAGMFTAQIAADGSSQMGFNNPMAVNNQRFVLNTMNWLSGNLSDVSTVAPSNSGLPTASTYMAKSGQSIDLAKIVTTVAADVQELKKYQEDMKNGIYNGNVSYATEYKNSYNTDNGSPGKGGGCTINRSGPSDPTLPLLALIAMGYLFRPRRLRAQ
ncbi:MAG TPA: JDVT-CTERM domain-containing protein [Rhodocyclaceae bacterium]|nr:JDVT-CTERM domain-containing protein [Rhodocyclaceae bacterium]